MASSALTSLGTLNYEKGAYAEAHSNYAELFESSPRFRQEALVGMGRASLARDQVAKAKEEFESALEINPNSESAKVGLGKVAIQQSDFETAESYLEPIAEQSTTEVGAEAQFYLGEMLQKQEQYNSAIEEYGKVKVLFEAFDTWVSRSMYNSAECHLRMGNRGEAMTILNSLIDTYPGTEAEQRARTLIDQADL